MLVGGDAQQGQESTFQGYLPIFKKHKVGAINWGLMKGRTNTIYAWDDPMLSGKEPKLWVHDIFRPDGSVFSRRQWYLSTILPRGDRYFL